MQCLRAVGGASRRAQSLHDILRPSMCGRSHTTWSPSPCGGPLQGREMETTAMRAAAVRADSAGSSPDAPTQPIGLTDPLSLSPAAKASVQILIVDDERTLRESCASMLKHEGYNVRVCSRGEEALETLKRVRFDIVLLDLYMAQVQGMELLRVTLETHAETIVIVMTGHPSVTSNLEALQAGAWDYLPKPFSATHLQILLGRAAHAVMVARETREQQAGGGGEGGASDKVPLIGVSPSFRRAIDLARRVASTDASVFITGESGVGKEQIAQFIHNHSRRSSRPLVAINCAALPEALLESEMFGHVKGAFTGAVRDKPGLLEMANGGTLFLDELIEMSKPIQAKLLRVIQDGVVRRVGSERTDAVVNVCFIACTNCNPEDALRSGQLREDLYYRLRVVPIPVPALRERPDDVPVLAAHFLDHYWRRHRGADEPLPTLSNAAIWALRAHSWPGNVRELQNVMEHAVVLHHVLQLAHVAGPGVGAERPDRGVAQRGEGLVGAAMAAPVVVEEMRREHRYVVGPLAQCGDRNRHDAQSVVQILTQHP